MLILGIETSCDETAAAVVEDGTKIVSNVLASSQEMQARYGGIIPEKAAREQVKAIIPVISEALKNSEYSDHQIIRKPAKSDSQILRYSGLPSVPSFLKIDALAVTVGPGLIGSLLVGVETAKTLAYVWNKPIIPVNHLIGHIYANWILPEYSEDSENQIIRRSEKSDGQNVRSSDSLSVPSFPAVVLIVSGGHTELGLMKDHGKLIWLGGTRDDAAGECFDKCARLLGLGYPGGPAIERAAANFPSQNSNLKFNLPRPMINEDNFDFSFSGLKTAVSNKIKSHGEMTAVLAYEIQEAITDVLVKKTLYASIKFKAKSVLLAGGVGANKRLRDKLHASVENNLPNVRIYVPPINLCTDNAAYIASSGFFNYHPVSWQKINAHPGLSIRGE